MTPRIDLPPRMRSLMSSVASASPVPTSASAPSRPSARGGVGDHGRDAGGVERRAGAAAGEVVDRRDDVAVARVERVRGAELERELAAARAPGRPRSPWRPRGGRRPSAPPARRRRRRRRRTSEPGAGSSTLSTAPAPVWMPQPSGAATREVDAVVDLDGVARVRERVRGEARLAEEVAVHRRCRRGACVVEPSGPHADGVELAEALAVGDVAGRAARALAAAAVAQQHVVAGARGR